MKNGLDLVFTMQLALELMDEYKLKGVIKNKANLFKKSIEKEVTRVYDVNYLENEKVTINAMNMKHRLISQIASLSEGDAMVFSEYANKFFENKAKAIEHTEIIFKDIK